MYHTKTGAEWTSHPTVAQRRTSKNFKNKRTVTQHDLDKNKLQSEVARQINSALAANIEVKAVEATSAFNCLYGGTILNATGNLLRGDAGLNECTGVMIRPKKFSLNFEITQAGAGLTNLVRVVVFRWRAEGVPVPSGILNNNSTAYAPLGNLYWINRKKIVVLEDRLYKLFDHGGGCDIVTDRFTIDPRHYPIQLPLSGAGSTPQQDGLFVLFISDDAIAPSPIVDYHLRLEFTDA